MVIRIPLPGGRSISFNQDTGVLRIQTAPVLDGDIIADMQVPDMGAIPSENVLDSITVKDTRTEKGFGAFCGEYDAEAKDNSNFSGQIPKKSFLGFYEGEIIRSREELDKIAKGRDAKSGYMDYVMSLDGGVTFMDGYERAQDRSKFSPVHLNHADKGTTACNVIRLLEDDRVAFFSSRDIFAGEELCFDYGSNFWKGREHLIV